MHITAQVEYGIRAMLELARAQRNNPESLLTVETISTAQEIPVKFLEGILRKLRLAGFIDTVRGPVGGHRLAQPSNKISLADIIRELDGPLAAIRGEKPEVVNYRESSKFLRDVWIALRASMRLILESTYLSDLEQGKLTKEVLNFIENPDTWTRR